MEIENIIRYAPRAVGLMEIENIIRYAPCAVGLMEIENLFHYTALAVGLKPPARQGEARLRGLWRIISSKTISPRGRDKGGRIRSVSPAHTSVTRIISLGLSR